MKNRTRSSTNAPYALRRAGACAVAAVIAACAAGCNYVAGATLIVSGPPKVPKVTELPESRTTVILVDDLNSVLPRRMLRDAIGTSAEEEILAQRLVDDGVLIPSVAARRATAGDTAAEKRSAVDIGRDVGAEVVIFVTLRSWTLTSTPGLLSPLAEAEVVVLDAVSNQRLWPSGEIPFTLTAELPPKSGADINMSISQQRQLNDVLARRAGSALARLFYDAPREYAADLREIY